MKIYNYQWNLYCSNKLLMGIQEPLGDILGDTIHMKPLWS